MQKSSLPGLLLVLVLVVAVAIWLDAPAWLLLFLLLLLAGLIGGLMGSERPSSPPPEEPPAPKFPPEAFYVQDQVIISGPVDAVATAVQAAEGIIQQSPLRRIAFSELDADVRACLNDCADADFAEYVINLYQLSGSETAVAEAIAAINQAVGRGSSVRAEPNWLSGHPWDPTGSPWDPTGSPWDPTGSSGADSQSAPPELFLKQWAFQQIELTGAKQPGTGRGVRIGVFDTSPYNTRSTAVLDWVVEPSPLALRLANYPTPTEDNAQKDLSNHGVFSAGLAHAVAPYADIQLIRVLNDNNVGDLFSLNEALFDFVRANTRGQRPEGVLGAVINMSLGIRVPPDEAGFNLPPEVQTLRLILRAAHCAGIVVVAAAGNDSANLPQPEPANLPANWAPVIGVAGTNQERGRGCFSNRGDLAAPGGDGRPDDKDPTKCVPANDVCGDQDCPTAVIGPVIKTEHNTGFAYWSGTSFATPMVSGLAALVIERGGGQLSPDEVRRVIECGVTAVSDPALGKGIINVRNTLDNFERCREG